MKQKIENMVGNRKEFLLVYLFSVCFVIKPNEKKAQNKSRKRSVFLTYK